MPIELHGENFQSWRKFDLTLDNLTVVVGSSNLGKSALVRSFKALVRNTLNAAQVRLGSEGIRIEAVIDGHHVIAERPRKDSVTYQVDGQDFQKLDGKIPQPVADLGMGLLEIGKVKLDPIFAGQFSEPFMLTATDGELNTILGAFSSTERLESGKKTANTRVAEKNAEAKVLAKNLRAVEARRSKLTVLAEQATAIQVEINTLEPVVERQQQTIKVLDELIAHRIRLTKLQIILDGVVIPGTEPVAASIERVQALQHLAARKIRRDKIQRVLDKLEVPAVEPVQRLLETAAAAGQAANSYVRKDRATATTDAIAACVETWTAIVSLFKYGKAVQEAEQALAAVKSSRAKEVIVKLEKRSEKIDAAINEGTRLAAGIKGLNSLIAARTAAKVLDDALPPLLAEYDAALEALEAIKTEYQQYQLDEAAKAAHRKAHAELAAKQKACPKCGEVISL